MKSATAGDASWSREAHREAVNGEIDIGDDRTLFDVGSLATARTQDLTQNLFDHQGDVGAGALVVQTRTSFSPTRASRISLGSEKTKVFFVCFLTITSEAPSSLHS
jgi:hypothetical protein